jgi:hypothetical protein
MREILPDIFHWTAQHPRIGIDVSSYWLRGGLVVLDPLLPRDGPGFLDGLDPPPEHVLLTNRHHYRDSGALSDRFQCTVWCAESGMHEFGESEPVRPFSFGDELPGGFVAVEVGEICPDETALYLPHHGGILAVADGIVRDGDSPLGFVPDEYMGDDPEAVKAGLRRAYRSLLDREIEHLLLAHGNPWTGGAGRALREFVDG